MGLLKEESAPGDADVEQPKETEPESPEIDATPATVRIVFVTEPESCMQTILKISSAEKIESNTSGIITISNSENESAERRMFDPFHEVCSTLGLWFENDRQTIRKSG